MKPAHCNYSIIPVLFCTQWYVYVNVCSVLQYNNWMYYSLIHEHLLYVDNVRLFNVFSYSGTVRTL